MAKPKPTEFQVRKSSPFNGRQWRVIGYIDGKRKQYWFSTEKEAKADAADRNRERSAYGSKVNLDSDARLEAFRASELLRPHGKTILDAVHFYLSHLARLSASIPVTEFAGKVRLEFDRRKTTGESSVRHYTSMLETIKKFEERFRDRQLSTITDSEIKNWLSALPLAIKTRNRHLGYLRNAFGLAFKEWHVLPTNPLTEVEPFHNPAAKGRKIEILTPEEMQRFLSALDTDWLPFFAISAFTGLRREEVSRLDWSETKLERSLIDLPFSKSKNGKRKLEEVPANLLDILSPFVRTEGSVKPRKKLALAMTKAALAAGIEWKQNCLRHSFCSYAVALKGLDWTATQADHSTRMLRDHYLEVVTKEDAERYWAIRL
jgi:integrase